jgi:catechol 2,3-dioxygenase-like lactoylglutathione lyase family enzyme
VKDESPTLLPTRSRVRRISHVNLRVRDVEESAQFYCTLFGLRQQGPDASSSNGRLCVVPSKSGRSEFGVVLSRGLPPRAELSGVDHFTFEVPVADDVNELYARARQRGAPATEPRFYRGAWQTFVFDPDGYKIEIRAERARQESDRHVPRQ